MISPVHTQSTCLFLILGVTMCKGINESTAHFHTPTQTHRHTHTHNTLIFLINFSALKCITSRLHYVHFPTDWLKRKVGFVAMLSNLLCASSSILHLGMSTSRIWYRCICTKVALQELTDLYKLYLC